MRIISITIIVLVCALLLLSPVQAQSVSPTCPTIQTAWHAQLDTVDGSGRYYLINPLTQGLPSHVGNVANLRYASNPPRWLVGGVKVAPDFRYVYHITYWTSDWTSAGETWFATHPANATVYFYFTMPAGELDHPNYGYGSIDRATVDTLLKPRP